MTTGNANELLLVDLSSIAHPIWHMSQAEPDPNHTSQQIVARVRALTAHHPHAAICCDSGKSFRHEVSAAYKANRPEAEAPLHHQIALAKEQLDADGFPIWHARGFEADDVIATAVARALAFAEPLPVLIVTGDKDLLQLVSPLVKAMSVRDGSICDEQGVWVKFGVKPTQMRDYLMLVGDAADNVKGAPGIGPKKAADLLARYGSLKAVYADLATHPTNFRPGMATALQDLKGRLEETRTLVTLRTDLDIPFETIAAERQPKQVPTFELLEEEPDMEAEVIEAAQVPLPTDAAARVESSTPQPDAPASPPTAVKDADIVPNALIPYERQLDPRSLREAQALATNMHQSRMFSAYGTPQAVLSTVMVGRELGLPAMASLRSIHNIEGKHALSAALMVALVLKSGFAEYFEPVSFDDKQATFVTKRKGARSEVTLTHTLEMAKTAGLLKPNSNWEKIPTDMLVARAQSRLCRMVYPDVCGGLYTPDELRDSARDTRVA